MGREEQTAEGSNHAGINGIMGGLGGTDMSYLGGLALIFLVVAGGIFGLVMIVSQSHIDTPAVDTFGETLSTQDNSTRQVASDNAPSFVYLAGGVGLIVGFMILIAVLIYLASAKSSNFRSRY
jgi:hypothetical protein